MHILFWKPFGITTAVLMGIQLCGAQKCKYNANNI